MPELGDKRAPKEELICAKIQFATCANPITITAELAASLVVVLGACLWRPRAAHSDFGCARARNNRSKRDSRDLRLLDTKQETKQELRTRLVCRTERAAFECSLHLTQQTNCKTTSAEQAKQQKQCRKSINFSSSFVVVFSDFALLFYVCVGFCCVGFALLARRKAAFAAAKRVAFLSRCNDLRLLEARLAKLAAFGAFRVCSI